jgi:hypothetical protein
MDSPLAEAVAAVGSLPCGYGALLRQAVHVWSQDSRVRAVWIAGSVASRTADRASDLDLIVSVGAADLAAFAGDWPRWRAAIADTVLARPVVSERVWTMITPEWLRWDVVLEPVTNLENPVPAPRIPAWDPDDLVAHMRVAEHQEGPSPERVER